MFGITMHNHIESSLVSEIHKRNEEAKVSARKWRKLYIETAVELGYSEDLAVALFGEEGSWNKAWVLCRDAALVNEMRDTVWKRARQ